MKAATGVAIAVGVFVVVAGTVATGFYLLSSRTPSQQQVTQKGKQEAGLQKSGTSISPVVDSSSPKEMTLAAGIEEGSLDAHATSKDGYSSADLDITNLTDQPLSVDLNGTILDSGDENIQRLGVGGMDPETMPVPSEPETPEQMIERMKKLVRKRLQDAKDRVEAGDRSPEALRDLLKETGDAQKLGEDSAADDAMETVQEAQGQNAKDAYEEFKNNPTEANKKAALDELGKAQAVGGNEEGVDGMADDVMNTPTQNPPASKPAPTKPSPEPAPEPYVPPPPSDPNVS